jgi:ubiquinone/menaquinone biosynthesis C-methylase UbiE
MATKTYGSIARVYDLIDLPFEYGRYRPLRRALFQGTGGTVLDAGVGTGRNIPFYPPGARMVGIDLSQAMLARAEARKVRLRSDVELSRMDVRALAFPDASFDYAAATFLFCVLEESDHLAALRELARVVKRGGEIRTLDYVQSRIPWRRCVMGLWAPWVRFAYGAAFDRDLKRHLDAADLEIVEERFLVADIVRLMRLRAK